MSAARRQPGGIGAVVLAGLVVVVSCRAFEPDFGAVEIPEVRSLRERALQRDAVLALRLDALLPAALRGAGADCWVVVSTAREPDPTFRLLVRGDSRPDGLVALSFCATDAGVDRLAIGAGLEANDGLYEVVTAAREEVGARLRDELERHRPSSVAINTALDLAAADGLSASQRDWLVAQVGDDLAARLVPSRGVVERFFGGLLPDEESLFAEAARITEGILHEVLSDREVIAAGTSVEDLRWAFRRRAAARDLPVAVDPAVEILRRGRGVAEERRMGLDLLLQPGDLVFLSAGIEYLGYRTRVGRWAYLLHEGESEEPAWVAAGLGALADAAESVAARLVAGGPVEVLDGADDETGAVRLRVGRVGYLLEPEPLPHPRLGTGVLAGRGIAGRSRGIAPWTAAGIGRAAVSLRLEETATGWDDQEVDLMVLEMAIVEEAGGRLAVPPQRSPFLID